MPQAAYVAVAKWATVYFGSAIAGAVAGAVAFTVVTAAINVGITKIVGALAGKPKQPSAAGGVQSRAVTVKGTDEYRQMIYGQAKTGGFASTSAAIVFLVSS